MTNRYYRRMGPITDFKFIEYINYMSFHRMRTYI